MKKILLGIALSALSILAVRAQYNPCVASSATNCSPAPSVTLAPVSPIALCLCGPVSASTTNITNSGLVVVVSIAESCAVMTNTIATNYPTIISNWTVVNWNSQVTTNAGLSAWFLPTNTGSGSITFYVKYTTPNPCIGTYITNKSASVLVTNCAPSISNQPASQAVCPGLGANMSVTATGTPPLRYQWRFGSANLAGATLSALTLANVQVTNAGNYTVLVTNAYGSVTSVIATLTVANVDIAETNRTVYVGGTTSFTLTNTCGDVTWQVSPAEPGGPYVNGSSIVAGTNCGIWTVIARSVANTNCTDSATLTVVYNSPDALSGGNGLQVYTPLK
jgi:hypothetical protein